MPGILVAAAAGLGTDAGAEVRAKATARIAALRFIVGVSLGLDRPLFGLAR